MATPAPFTVTVTEAALELMEEDRGVDAQTYTVTTLEELLELSWACGTAACESDLAWSMEEVWGSDAAEIAAARRVASALEQQIMTGCEHFGMAV